MCIGNDRSHDWNLSENSEQRTTLCQKETQKGLGQGHSVSQSGLQVCIASLNLLLYNQHITCQNKLLKRMTERKVR